VISSIYLISHCRDFHISLSGLCVCTYGKFQFNFLVPFFYPKPKRGHTLPLHVLKIRLIWAEIFVLVQTCLPFSWHPPENKQRIKSPGLCESSHSQLLLYPEIKGTTFLYFFSLLLYIFRATTCVVKW